MEEVENAEHTEALVEFQVVKVVRLVGGEEREVVAAVGIQRVQGGKCQPQPN